MAVWIDTELEGGWRSALAGQTARPFAAALKQFYCQELAGPHPIYPARDALFRAFKLTPLDNVKVVILGQDPYHGPGQAMGLAFSVPRDVKIPPSLRNIYREIENDIGAPPPPHGDLTHWATQGVLLLNTVLSVRANAAGSHRGKGWEAFTDAAIKAVSDRRKNCAFLLWGSAAQAKQTLIDEAKHLILTAPHPSPLSAHRGFFGCQHFSKANEYLEAHGRGAIAWSAQ
ncbi:MAG: uracil-DNA glycosylase [Pseudomonadota bacterium]